MPTALLFVRKIHEKLFLQAGNGGVMQQNKVKIKTSHAQKKENRAGYFFIAPYLTFFTVFTGIPFLMAIGMSFLNIKYITKLDNLKFVGLKNFTKIFPPVRLQYG